MICVDCISHVPALLTLDIPGYQGRAALLMAFLLLVAQSSDVLQYVWGSFAGDTGSRRRSHHPRQSKALSAARRAQSLWVASFGGSRPSTHGKRPQWL